MKKLDNVDFEECKKIIGGYAEPVPTCDGGLMLVHEMGKLIGLRPNVKATILMLGAAHVLISDLLGIPPADIVVGTVVLFDSNEEADRVLGRPPKDIEPEEDCAFCGKPSDPDHGWADCKLPLAKASCALCGYQLTEDEAQSGSACEPCIKAASAPGLGNPEDGAPIN